MKLFFYLIFSLFTLFSFAQTWQSAYDSCVKYQEQQKFKKAVEWGDKALELYEKQVSLKDTNYSNILSTQSANCYYSGYYDKAKFYAVKDSVWIIQNIGELNHRFSDCCVILGLLYQKQGLFNLAEKLFLKAKRLDLELYGKNSDNYILVCSNLGTLYQDKGDYANAEVIYREVLHLCSDNNQFNSSCNHLCANFGLLQKLKGNYEEAEKLYKRTINFYHKNQSTENMDYVITCNNLANIYASQNRLYEAETLMMHIKSTITRLIGTEHPDYFTFTNNLAAFYQIKREYDKAEALYSDALLKVTNKFGKSHPMYANVINNMGMLFLLKNKYAEAESLIVKAKQIRKEIFGNQHPEYAKSCLNLAKLYMKQHLYDRALPYLIDAVKIKMNEIENNFVVLSQQEKENYLEMNASEYFTYLNLFTLLTYKKNPSISDYAYDMAIQLKGKILQSSEKIKNRILNSKDEKLKNMYLEWKMTKDKYAKLANMTNLQRKKQQLNLDSLEQQIRELEKQLSIKSEDFAKTFSPKHTTWKEIRNTLEYNQTAIEIVRINMKDTKLTQQDSIIYMILLVRKASEHPEVIVLPSGNILEKEYLINYKRSTRHKIYDPYSYNAFWKTIKMALKDTKTVYFSPDGVYHQINLATLQNPENQKYVFDEVQIINITNSKDILDNQKFTTNNNYLIGNPKFNLELDTKNNEKPVEQRGIENLSQLEGAEKEVKQISVILPNAKTTVGTEATEEYVKSIKNPHILHIATHGYFKKEQYQSSTQAMLNAGLLFAGVVDYDRMDIRPLDKEDGKLTAFEVMNMELDSTELVVLSACETGLGQASKEGVYGLQRAFKVAGAQTIIMSLWKVNDEATQLLMTKFYENWQKKGMDKRKAFETAQKDIRKQYKEPYYWGAFVMIE